MVLENTIEPPETNSNNGTVIWGRSVDAAAIHGGQEGGNRAVEVGLDISFFFEGRDGSGGDGVGKGVGVEVDETGHGYFSLFFVCLLSQGSPPKAI